MRVVVTGGGIAGLAAALRLREGLGRAARITVVDHAARLGGKLRTEAFGDGYAEAGAEAFLVTDPAVVELAHRVGLGAALRHPAPVPAALAVGGELRPLPRGVYAGRGEGLSLAATVPALAAACRTESTLTGAVRVALAGRSAPAGPVFATVEGGMGRLVDAAAAASGAKLRLGAPVRHLARAGGAWRVGVGGQTLDADAVVLAVPARPAARLLAEISPPAAAEIGVLDYASVALVTFAVRGAQLPELSGFLVPASEGYAVKALTIFTTKWAHLARTDGLAVIRASVGRYGETAVLHRGDEELAALVHAELGTLLGAALPVPEAVRVTRWGGALPQYAPGHLDRVARARGELADLPGLALAGAAYAGVGIPACVRSGWAAAERLLGSDT